MLSITISEYKQHGCPNCGCDSAQAGYASGGGRTTGKCRHCSLKFEIRADSITSSTEGKVTTKYGTGRKDKNGLDIMEHASIIQHPRSAFAWHWEPEDVRPDEGEYWKSRGPGYPDVSGFVKTKQAGERILAMVHEVLGTTKCKTFLDFRPSEPTWIQFKFHQDEFDIKMLDGLTPHGIITKEIIQRCKL